MLLPNVNETFKCPNYKKYINYVTTSFSNELTESKMKGNEFLFNQLCGPHY